MISPDYGVLCGINYTPVLFREPTLDVEGDVDGFPASSQTTASRFPPSDEGLYLEPETLILLKGLW